MVLFFEWFLLQPDYDDGDYKSKPFFRQNSKDNERKKYGNLNIILGTCFYLEKLFYPALLGV